MPESTVACPHCQQPIRVMTEHAGNQVACPLCSGVLVVPIVSHTFACTHCVEPFQVTTEMLGQAVRCPSCGGAVQTPVGGIAQKAIQPNGTLGDKPTSEPNAPSETRTQVAQPESAAEQPAGSPDREKRKRPKPRPRARPKPRQDRLRDATAKADAKFDAKVDAKIDAKPEKKVGHSLKATDSIPTTSTAPELHKRVEGRVNPANIPVLISPTRSIGSGNSAADLLPPRYEALLPRMSDIALSPDGKAVASMTFQEPVKTIMVHGQERVLRRLSPKEKVARRNQRNVVIFLIGMIFLLIAVALFARW